MSRAATAQAIQATLNLYMVTIKNPDGTTKTVLKSQPLRLEKGVHCNFHPNWGVA